MKRFKEIASRLGAWFSDQKILYWWFVIVMMTPSLFLFITEPMTLLMRIPFLAFPLAFYMVALQLSRRPGIPQWVLLPMCIFGAFQLVLLYLFGNSIIAVDMFLNLATTNSGEALELLSKLIPAIVGVCVLYIPTLYLAVRSIRSRDRLTAPFRRRNLRIALILFFVGLFGGIGARLHSNDYRLQLHLFPTNIFYNIRLAVENWERSSNYHNTSRDFTFEARSEHPDSLPEIYIMVVGETTRAMNMSLYGYPRPTTPRLDTTSRLVHFTDLLTQTNATHKSVPMLLSPVSAQNFDSIYYVKSVISAFKEVGFRTAFISNQRRNNSFIDFFGEEADYVHFLKDGKPDSYLPSDYVLLAPVDSLLATGTRKQLIVLHTYGSHFDYQGRYGNEDRRFTPDRVESVTPAERDRLINAYDNSIHLTDSLLSGLMQRLTATGAPAALLYTSDHGEDIYDDRRERFLHASPIPTYYQIHVPGILWVSAAYDSLYPQTLQQAGLNSTKPMCSNIFFHTLLHTAGVATPYRNDSLAVTSDRFTVLPRHYLSDHNQPRTFDRIGLRKQDKAMFKKQGLQFP